VTSWSAARSVDEAGRKNGYAASGRGQTLVVSGTQSAAGPRNQDSRSAHRISRPAIRRIRLITRSPSVYCQSTAMRLPAPLVIWLIDKCRDGMTGFGETRRAKPHSMRSTSPQFATLAQFIEHRACRGYGMKIADLNACQVSPDAATQWYCAPTDGSHRAIPTIKCTCTRIPRAFVHPITRSNRFERFGAHPTWPPLRTWSHQRTRGP